MDKSYCIFGDSVTQTAYVKVAWVDLLKTYLEDKLNPEDFLDGLHPNEQGHRKMFEIIKNYF